MSSKTAHCIRSTSFVSHGGEARKVANKAEGKTSMPDGTELNTIVLEYAAYIAALGAGVSATILIYTKVIKPVVIHFSQWYEMLDKVDKIFEEVTPNGGSSIKDKINHIDTGVQITQQVQQAMAADSKAALFRTDAEGNVVWVNRTYTRIVARDISECLGHGWHNVIAPEERDKVVAEWYKAVEESREFYLDVNLITPTGEKTLVRVRSYKLVNAEGDIIGYWGNCTPKKP
jgi:PAS domain S-box-containing protein